ncbi:hypothetical protein H4R18_005136 [Coemansia javaensis]|uniref:DUF4246 domain-containing protein n=1 Tax=Coemansia javaensis TaxID=2761396 RepID=A0A9W8LFV3_9FUNG|nr:hypothetical protein H4R18_005136 [Coemansia javaensis]
MDFAEFSERFRRRFRASAIYRNGDTHVNTCSEKRIRGMSSAIRAKDRWMDKLGNDEIRAHWSHEAAQQGLTEREIEYVLDELARYAALHVPGSGVCLSPVDQVWVSDSLVDEATAAELRRYTAILEDVPDRLRDWHPGSDGQVLNLVHPSLYPIVYGITPILSEPIASPAAALEVRTFGAFPGAPEAWKAAFESVAAAAGGADPQQQPRFRLVQRGVAYVSPRFCWLPSEFRVAEDGAVAIESYINNLHPVRHAALYPTIAAVFARFVPMLAHVLTDLVYPRGPRVPVHADALFEYDGPEPEKGFDPGDPGDSDDGYDAEEAYYERYEAWRDTRRFVESQPDKFAAPERRMVPVTLRGRRLQAIVKMSSIRLTPDNPEYAGGSWHVEAMANERIVATGIYYYDVENITESTLEFRESLEKEELEYFREGDQREGARLAYDAFEGRSQGRLVQHIGGVAAAHGRCIVFPNVYQHRVSEFRLADPTKPGHRKILAFFFVNPTVRVPSSEIVPPQQQDWWAPAALGRYCMPMLPAVVRDGILGYVDFPMPLAAAKEPRLELMAERTANNSSAEEVSGFDAEFHLCEH